MDIDIDLKTNFTPEDIFDVVRASRVDAKSGKLAKHNVGVYFQNIPVDRVTGLSAIPHKQAEEHGYFKVDFLHLSILDEFESKDEIKALMKIPPDWSLLEDEEVVEKLFQIGRKFDVVKKVKPTSVQELADIIALIRPGKRMLLNAYLKDREAVRKELYVKPDNDLAWYKKPHAVAYALTIVLQLHLIKGGVL